MENFKRNITSKQRFTFGWFQALDHIFGRKRGFKWTRKARTKFYESFHKDLKKKGKGKVYEVERVRDLTAKEFKKKYLRKGIPVILDGAAKDWSCVRDWGLDYFIDKHGSDNITVVDEIEMNESGGVERKYYTSTLKKELGDIKKGGTNYYKFYPLMNWHPEHLKDINQSFLKSRIEWFSTFRTYQVFIGGNTTFTNLHNASASNFFTQVVGEKEWYLYPIYYTSIFDPSPTDGMSRGAPIKTKQGPFDPFNPDYTSPYHLFEYIDSYHMILKPGDIFFNPPYYWHAVRNNSVSIGLGFRWIAPMSVFKISPFYFTLDVFSKIWIRAFQAYRDINILHAKEAEEFTKKGN